MPTTPRKARLLLKNGQAKIVGRDPFTIQLIYGSSGYTQPVDKGKRRELEIEKSHHNDAYVIAGGMTQPRVLKPLMQHDLVLFEGRIYPVVGVQNLGTRLSLKPEPGCKTKYKTAAMNKVKPLKTRGGICEQQA